MAPCQDRAYTKPTRLLNPDVSSSDLHGSAHTATEAPLCAHHRQMYHALRLPDKCAVTTC